MIDWWAISNGITVLAIANGNQDQWTKWWPRIVSFAGLAGIYHEMVLNTIDRPWLLGVLAGMVGVAPVVGLDRWLKERDGSGGKS